MSRQRPVGDDGMRPFYNTIKRSSRIPMIHGDENERLYVDEAIGTPTTSACLEGGRHRVADITAPDARIGVPAGTLSSAMSSATATETTASNNHRHAQTSMATVVPTYSNGIQTSVRPSPSSVPNRERKWRLHQGKNRFFCNGRIITSRQSGVFIFTLFLISTTLTLFFIFESAFLTEKISAVMPVIAGLLAISVVVNLLQTSFTDPGILPRATSLEVIDAERQYQNDPAYVAADSQARGPPPRTKQIVINGQTIRLKYCFTCRLFRPPRSSHCSICDNCILNFDHHCPWVGNCVGLRNYRYFYFFITSLTALVIFIFSCCTLHLVVLTRQKNSNFLDAIKESPVSLAIALICFFSVWSIFGLSGFHTYLLASNQTTNEDIKGSFNRKRRPTVINPYSVGNPFGNCCVRLCGPDPPSLIDRRGFHIDEPDVVREHMNNGIGYRSTETVEQGGGAMNRVFSVSVSDAPVV